MKKEHGLSLIALIIIVLIVAYVVMIGITKVKNYIENEKNEDIKTAMLQIQAKITEIHNKHTVDEEANPLVGEPLNIGDMDIKYKISDEVRRELEQLEEPELYILTQEDIENMAIKDVTVDEEKFYIVNYKLDDVYYSLGIDGKYSLLEMEGKKVQKIEMPAAEGQEEKKEETETVKEENTEGEDNEEIENVDEKEEKEE